MRTHPRIRSAAAPIAATILLPCGLLAATSNPWQGLIDDESLPAESRKGARFLSEHLDFGQYAALPSGHQRRLLRYAADHMDGSPSLVLCWGEGTAREIVHAYQAVEQAGESVRREDRRPIDAATAFQASLADHWSRTATNGTGQGAQGQPVTLTWSFVPDGTIIPGGEVTGEATNDPSDLRAWLAGLYGGSATDPAHLQPWFHIFQDTFDNIAAQTGLRYVYEPNDDGATLSPFSSGQGVLGVRGDVRIAGHLLDGNSNVLAYNYFPDYSEMVIDTGDNFFGTTTGNVLRLRNVVEHEHGHGLGLGHVCPLDNTKLMEPFVNLGFTGIQFDEVYTLQRLYGDTLEVHGSNRDNDTLAKATPLPIVVNTPYLKEWIGIDDNSDVDHFSFPLPSGTQLTVRIVPSPHNYLEGEQDSSTGNCTPGTPFDSSAMQDLSFEIIDSDQSTVLASASSQPAGFTETVIDLPIIRNDTYYLKVQGSGTDFSQLYRLEVEATTPAVAIQLTGVNLTRELFNGRNGAADPGETIELELSLENLGLVSASNISASLTLPPGAISFDTTKTYGSLASGAGSTQPFVFAPAGACGETLDLSLAVTADGGYSTTIPFSLTLGVETAFFGEDFDASGSLPAGWTSTTTRSGSGWSIASTAHSAPNAAFAANPSRAGSSTLTTSSIAIGASPGTVSFRQFYDTDGGYDGGVMEVSVGGGTWQDILDSGASFVRGGYNFALSGNNNPLAGRSGWSGDSGGFIETVVALPASMANQNVQFRFTIGHDVRVGANGWYLDTLQYNSFTCDSGGIDLVLGSTDTTASELGSLADDAEIHVSAILPVTSDIPVTLQTTGSADPFADFITFSDLTLTAGNDTASAALTAVNDGLVEGQETLQVTSPGASGTVNLTLNDTPYADWAASQLGMVGDNLPFDDFDNDGSSNVEELIFGTDASLPSSTPLIQLVPSGADFEISVPLASLPDGVTVDAEASSDLSNWSNTRVTRLTNGFRLDGTDDQGFIRLIYEVMEGAP